MGFMPPGNYLDLQNLVTNIHDLRTEGLLNSHANRWTTTNVGHMHGGRSSVISLGELQELAHEIHFTKAQAAAMEAKADARDAKMKAAIEANAKLTAAQKTKMEAGVDAADTKFHAWVDAHTDATGLQELRRLLLTKRDRFEDTNQHEKEMACIKATGHSQC